MRVFKVLLKKSNPDFLMTSYNNLNGEFVSQNEHLLKYVLRKLLGFKGVVISDWGGVNYRWKSLKAGVDINMPGDEDTSWKEVAEAMDKGLISEENLERALDYVLVALEKCQKKKQVKENNKQLLRRLATESIVLLKNDDQALPLSKKDRIVVVGGLAYR